MQAARYARGVHTWRVQRASEGHPHIIHTLSRDSGDAQGLRAAAPLVPTLIPTLESLKQLISDTVKPPSATDITSDDEFKAPPPSIISPGHFGGGGAAGAAVETTPGPPAGGEAASSAAAPTPLAERWKAVPTATRESIFKYMTGALGGSMLNTQVGMQGCGRGVGRWVGGWDVFWGWGQGKGQLPPGKGGGGSGLAVGCMDK
jgi:hypothetical protein